jgi:hypothetical protein
MADHMTAEQLREHLLYVDSKLARIDAKYARQSELLLQSRALLGNLAARLSGMAAVPADHVVVPRDPTEEMIAAGCRQWDSTPADQYQIECCRDTYRAMLAAAPEPQESPL